MLSLLPNISFSRFISDASLASLKNVRNFFNEKPLTGKEAEKYLRETNKSFLDYYYLGILFFENNKTKLAVEYFTKSIKKKDDYYATYLSRAYSYYLLKKITLGMRDLDLIIKNANTEYLIGMAYYYKGLIQSENPYKYGGCDKATQSFNKALIFKLIRPEILYQIAFCNSSNYQVAMEKINQAIQLATGKDGQTKYFLLKGDILYRGGLYQKALETYKITLQSIKSNNLWYQEVTEKIEATQQRILLNNMQKRLLNKVKSYCVFSGNGMVCFEK